jgi:16S rRNA (guanine966-N2)-methyltransferase
MRIISGKFKGSKLNIPDSKYTRPLKDQAKESIFNLLTHSNKISFQFDEKNILDLYSGSGSFGLEALSRKASEVYFVEKQIETIKVLEQNIHKLKCKKKTAIFKDDVFKVIESNFFYKKEFDLIFCDPPFKDTIVEKLIDTIKNRGLLKKNGIIILHRNKNIKENLPNYFEVIEERLYGLSKIIFGSFLL